MSSINECKSSLKCREDRTKFMNEWNKKKVIQKTRSMKAWEKAVVMSIRQVSCLRKQPKLNQMKCEFEI